jgi:hypothetical protein
VITTKHIEYTKNADAAGQGQRWYSGQDLSSSVIGFVTGPFVFFVVNPD